MVSQCDGVIVTGLMKVCQCHYVVVVVAALLVGLMTATCVVVIASVLVILIYRRRWVIRCIVMMEYFKWHN